MLAAASEVSLINVLLVLIMLRLAVISTDDVVVFRVFVA